MPEIDTDTRWRLLEFLRSNGMPGQLSRAVDAAAAQCEHTTGDPCAYAVFADECYSYWQDNKALTLQAVLRGAAQPLPVLKHPPRGSRVGGETGESGESGKGGKSGRGGDQFPGQAHAGAEEECARAQRRDHKRKQMRTHQSICIKCKSTEFTTTEYEEQSRAADEGGTPWRKCENPKCMYKWKVHGIEVNEKPRSKCKTRRAR